MRKQPNRERSCSKPHLTGLRTGKQAGRQAYCTHDLNVAAQAASSTLKPDLEAHLVASTGSPSRLDWPMAPRSPRAPPPLCGSRVA